MECTERIMVLWIICFLTAFCTISVALATVPQPENVRVTSINADVVLEWDPPRLSPGNLTYTAGYTPGYNSFRGPTIVCQSQSERSCDFTDYLSSFGIYKFLVRAEFQTEASHWVNTSEFSIDKDTLIGAPTVRLSSKAGNLEVDIQDPVSRNPGFLKKVYGHGLCFNVRYWKENETENATVLNCKQQNSLVLSSELKPKTRYCVQAQVYIPSHEKASDFSRVMCETITQGRAEPWFIVSAMVGSLVVVSVTVLLLFLIGWYSYKGIKFMFPKVKLPESFKQLVEPTHSYIFVAMQTSSQPEEKCHEVCILSELTEGTETDEGTPL